MILAAVLALRAVAERREASPPLPLAWRGGQLCVALAVGEERPLWLVLDTGARRSTLSRAARDRLAAAGAPVAADGSVSVEGGSVSGYALGRLEFGLGDSADEEGCLGIDFLARFQVGLDLREKTLRLWPASASIPDWFTAPSEERVRLPMTERAEGWCVPVEVGNLTVPMVLDTGAPTTFLHTDVAELLRGARKAKRDDPPVRFYDGLHRVRTYAVRDVGLGGMAFGQRTVGVARVPRMTGLLGRDLLTPLKALLDYPGGTATFVGFEGAALPPRDGPRVILPSGVVAHWPLGEVANAPPGCAYTMPKGYREVFNRDESVDLVPVKGS